MLDNALRQAGLSRLATTLTELARPSIRLLTRPAQEHDISLGQSKIGGSVRFQYGLAEEAVARVS